MRRIWDVAQHPEWLVFEAEGQLQIRPQQFVIAWHLLNNPGEWMCEQKPHHTPAHPLITCPKARTRFDPYMHLPPPLLQARSVS